MYATAPRLTLWGVAPVAVTILALSMNLAVTRGMEAHAATCGPRRYRRSSCS
ncbi:hypothetical protein LP420_38060 [Massilia sp. B-10]|nr:hypothetical protein LP420_38060 [Massilia sp. B-10]